MGEDREGIRENNKVIMEKVKEMVQDTMDVIDHNKKQMYLI